MKLISRFETIIVILLVVDSCDIYAKPDAEIQVPFPKFSTRPSSTTIYCHSILDNELRGLNEDPTANKKSAGVIVAKIYKSGSGVNNKLKLEFLDKEVMAYSELAPLPNVRYSTAFPYKVLNDEPTNFIAIGNRRDLIQTLTINRETGTMIWTQHYASLPEHGHPAVMSTFFVCSPTPD
jgi:hypothetical protein